MRRLALLLAGGALWLILAALPALADGGPHVSAINNGSLGINADSCAGCHRAHTAQGPYLIQAADEEALCLTCHGAASTGSSVDVMTGIQYRLGALPPVRGVTQLGALRNGGFDEARLGTPSRLAYLRSATDVSMRPKVAVGAAAPVTSSHLDLDGVGGVVSQGIAWGNGENNTGVGPAVELTCASCHNPHGNGQYRILNPIPEANGAGFDDAVAVGVSSSNALADLINTVTSHDLQVGDLVTLTGVTGVADGSYVVYAIPNGISFRVQTIANGIGFATPFDVSASGAGGSFVKTSRPVTDAPLPLTGDTRNYTVIQIKGGQGLDASYLLYASQVVEAAGLGWVPASTPVAISSIATSDTITTSTNHGLSVGDLVTIAGSTSTPDINGSQTVLSVSSPTAFKLIGVDITTAGGGGTVSRNAIPGDYSATGGDYMHRTAPWNPGVNNPACDPTAFNTNNSARCGAANDAPNGQPDTYTSGTLAGEVAFSTQITAWCAGCHTRYYANENPNPGGEPGSSPYTVRNLGTIDLTTDFITTLSVTTGSATSPGLVVGDIVLISGRTGSTPDINGSWTVVYVSGNTFRIGSDLATPVDITVAGSGGSVDRTSNPQSASSWWFPRGGDSIFKYQHRTVPNRACVTCHVTHGSNAVMSGPYSSTVAYPDGTVSASSRLLKVTNRGTCQMCHDPTGTTAAGTTNGTPFSVP